MTDIGFDKSPVITKHIYRAPKWVHLISANPVDLITEAALLHAQAILRGQFGVHSHKCIQPSMFEGDILLGTEAGVGLITWENIASVLPEEIADAYLVTNDIFMEFEKFYADPKEFREFDDLLKIFWDQHGLVYALCDPSKVIMIEM